MRIKSSARKTSKPFPRKAPAAAPKSAEPNVATDRVKKATLSRSTPFFV